MSGDRNELSNRRSPHRGDPTLTVPPNPAFSATVGLSSADTAATPTHSFGDYELLAEIARGGMGIVYKARQISLNRVVAIKMILSGRLASAADVQRFHQEAEAAAGLDHPNVLPIHDVGEQNGQHYFSMKLVEGGNLSDQVGALVADSRVAVTLMERIARGVYFAHQRGILHRDLKPANILLDADGTPYVTDFGLAKKTEADSSLTQSGAIVGTPSYMAPEQARGVKGITIAVDVYSLGAILYELLTGRAPFKGDSIAQTLRMVEEQEPVPPRRLRVTCDPDLEAIALKCLEKDPARRYETAGALADDLRRWLDGETVNARRASASRRALKWVKRNPAVAGLTALCALVLFGGASVSSYYGIQSARQARLTADEAERAKKSAREATVASEQAKDALCRGTYEQARSLRLAGQSGWRDKSLELLRQSAQLRARPRLSDEPPSDLPALANMRTEAVLALQRPFARLVRVLPGYTSMPVHFSQDGRRVFQVFVEDVETHKSGMAFVDVTTGREISRSKFDDVTQSALGGPFNLNALNHDGTRAVIVNPLSNSAHIHEVPSLRKLTELKNATMADPMAVPVTYARLRYSPNGSRIAAVARAGNEAQIVVWDVNQPTAPRVILRQPIAKAIAADFTRLADDGGDFAALRFTGDSNRLSFTAPDRKTYRVVDLTADPPKIVDEIPISVQFDSAEWHPNGEVLAISETSGIMHVKVSLWDVQRKAIRAKCGEERTLSPEFQGKHMPVAFSPNGQFLAIGGSGSTLQIYGALDGVEVLTLDTGTTISFGVNRLLWTADNELVSTEFFGGIKIWGVEQPTEVIAIPQLKPLDKPAYSADGRWLAVFAPSGKISKSNAPVAMRRFGNIDDRDRIALIDRKTHEVVRFLPGFDSIVGRLFFSPDSQHLVVDQTSAEKSAIVVRTLAGEEVLRREVPKAKGVRDWSGTFYGPQGQLLTLADVERREGKETKYATVLWNVADEQPVKGFPEFNSRQVGRAESAISSDGSRLLVSPTPIELMTTKGKGSEPRVFRLFEIPSGTLVATWPFAVGPEESMVFTTRLGAGGRRTLSIQAPLGVMRGENVDLSNIHWIVNDLTTGEVLLRFQNRCRADDANDFSADSGLLAVGAEQGYIDLWDVDGKARLFRWQPHGDKSVQHVKFAPDGDVATVAEGEDRLVVLRLGEVRVKLTELGLGW